MAPLPIFAPAATIYKQIKMQQQLQDTFAHLAGLPLTNTTRNGEIQFFHFGSTHYTTPQGLVLDVGAFTLAVNCPWQLTLPGGDTISHTEVFLPKRVTELPDPKARFDWKVPGANQRDQRLKELINKGTDVRVAGASANENQVLHLQFSNGMLLTVIPDAATPETEYWHLFSNPDQRISMRAGKNGLQLL